MQKEMIQEYHCDDYRLLVLMHEIEENKKTKPTPWYVTPMWIFCVGASILIALAWWFD